jgi:hypothetical protein
MCLWPGASFLSGRTVAIIRSFLDFDRELSHCQRVQVKSKFLTYITSRCRGVAVLLRLLGPWLMDGDSKVSGAYGARIFRAEISRARK